MTVEQGLYRHFKGDLYYVIGTVLNGENLTDEWVLMVPLVEHKNPPTGMRIQRLQRFLEYVTVDRSFGPYKVQRWEKVTTNE